MIFDVNEGIGCPQIDADVVGEQTEESIKHSGSPLNLGCDAATVVSALSAISVVAAPKWP